MFPGLQGGVNVPSPCGLHTTDCRKIAELHAIFFSTLTPDKRGCDAIRQAGAVFSAAHDLGLGGLEEVRDLPRDERLPRARRAPEHHAAHVVDPELAQDVRGVHAAREGPAAEGELEGPFF